MDQIASAAEVASVAGEAVRRARTRCAVRRLLLWRSAPVETLRRRRPGNPPRLVFLQGFLQRIRAEQ